MLWTGMVRSLGQLQGHPSADVPVGRKLRVGAPSRDNPGPLGLGHGLPAHLSLLSKPCPPSDPLHGVSVYKRQMHGAHSSEGSSGQTVSTHGSTQHLAVSAPGRAAAFPGGSHNVLIRQLEAVPPPHQPMPVSWSAVCHLWKNYFDIYCVLLMKRTFRGCV